LVITMAEMRTRLRGGAVEGVSIPESHGPGTADADAGMTAGGNTGAGIPGLSSWNPGVPKSRM